LELFGGKYRPGGIPTVIGGFPTMIGGSMCGGGSGPGGAGDALLTDGLRFDKDSIMVRLQVDGVGGNQGRRQASELAAPLKER
jgi:hypothetical protein